MEVGHLFFEWHDNLREVELRWAHGSQMREFFDKGLRKWPEPYLQRYRTSISYGWVRSNATLLMVLREGEVVYPALMNEEPQTRVQTGPDTPEEE
jgi:hypothetical protein